MMQPITLTTTAAALLLLGASGAMAGGEKCRKAAEARQAALAGDCGQSTEECLSAMAASIRAKGWLGVETEKNGYGRYQIVEVAEESPAATAGFRSGDVLLALNGIDLYAEDKSELKGVKKSLVVGSRVSYLVERDGTRVALEATLAEVPPRVMAQWIGQHMLDQHAHIEVASG